MNAQNANHAKTGILQVPKYQANGITRNKSNIEGAGSVRWAVTEKKPASPVEISAADLAAVGSMPGLEASSDSSDIKKPRSSTSSTTTNKYVYSWDTKKSMGPMPSAINAKSSAGISRFDFRAKLPKDRWIRVLAALTISSLSGASFFFWPALVISTNRQILASFISTAGTLPLYMFLFFFGFSMIASSQLCESIGAQVQVIIGAFLVLIGFLVAAQGLVILDAFTFLSGFGVLCAVGCGMFYAAPIAAMKKWFPDNPIFGMTIPVAGMGFGACIGIAVWYNAFIRTPTQPDIIISVTGAVYFVLIFISALFLGPPLNEDKNHFYEEQIAIPEEKLRDPDGVSFLTPPIYVPLKKVVRSFEFWTIWVFYFSLLIVPFCLYATLLVHVIDNVALANYEAYRILLIFGVGNFLGHLLGLGLIRFFESAKLIALASVLVEGVSGGLLLPYIRDLQLNWLKGVGFLIHFMIGIGTSSVPLLLRQLYGTFSVNAYHGLVVSSYCFDAAITYGVTQGADSLTNIYNTTLFGCICCVVVIFLFLFVEVSESGRLYRFLAPKEKQPFCTLSLLNSSYIEVYRNPQDGRYWRYFNRDADMKRILELLKSNPEYYQEMYIAEKAKIPQSPADVGWISWSLNSALVSSLSFSAVLCALIFLVPFIALVVKLVNCTDQNWGPIEQLSNAWERFLVYSVFNLVIPLIFLLSLSVVMAYALVTPVTKMRRRIQDVDSFVFNADVHKADFTAIRELYQLNCAVWALRQSMRTFSKFVPETVVRNTIKDGKLQNLDARRKNVTVFFSDIASFTSISETLDQQVLIDLLTTYLTAMIQIIEEHGGVVVEILGDGIFAIWNSPDEVDNHAFKACKCAVEQQVAMEYINTELAPVMLQHNLPPMKIRIGINTGIVFTGIIGSSSKMKFGCIGADMHFAAVLEDTCKIYASRIIISNETRDQIDPEDLGFFVFRELDTVESGGHTTPIYEILVEATVELANDSMDSIQNRMLLMADLKTYGSALQFFRNGEFQLAKNELFMVPEPRRDKYWELLNDRIEKYREEFGPSITTSGKFDSWTAGVQHLK